MGVSLHKINKWANMLMGKSSYHVNQDEGKYYSVKEIRGYYNNLTEKITRFAAPGNEIPITKHDNGVVTYFSIAIFQYGLAAYDLWLSDGDANNYAKFCNCVDWAIANQEKSGAWKTFESQNPNQPYSAMAQGEGISLLVRACLQGNSDAMPAAERAFNFLLKSREEGGVADYAEGGLRLYEFTYMPLVLNGWIFASWGLLDYYKLTGNAKAQESWNLTIQTMLSELKQFDTGYWSYYNNGRAIASAFYHNLHIAQLNVMADLTGEDGFSLMSRSFQTYRSSKINSIRAFIKKAVQKVLE